MCLSGVTLSSTTVYSLTLVHGAVCSLLSNSLIVVVRLRELMRYLCKLGAALGGRLVCSVLRTWGLNESGENMSKKYPRVGMIRRWMEIYSTPQQHLLLHLLCFTSLRPVVFLEFVLHQLFQYRNVMK